MNAKIATAIKSAVAEAKSEVVVNTPSDLKDHADKSLRMFNASMGLRNGSMARAIYAIYLGLRLEMIQAQTLREYFDSASSKETRTDSINTVLDKIWDFDHQSEGADRKPAPQKFRAMVTQCLAAGFLLWDYHATNAGETKIIISNAGRINEKATLKVPGPVFYANEDDAGAAWSEGALLDGSNKRTIEALQMIGRKTYIDSKGGATNSDDLSKKTVGKTNTPNLLNVVTDRIAKMAKDTPDAFNKEEMQQAVRNLRTELAMLSPDMGEEYDEKQLALEVEDVTREVMNLKARLGDKPLLARIARLYDALEEASKDDNIAAALEEAKISLK